MAKRIVDEAEREYQRTYQAVYRRTARARAAHQVHRRRHESKFPGRKKASNAVEAAIHRGDLVRSLCEVCGITRKVEAHHDDYSQPLNVRWLCEKHHKEHHAKLRRFAARR